MTIRKFKTSKKTLTSAILGLSFSTMSTEANSADIMKDHYHKVITQNGIQKRIQKNEQKEEEELCSQDRHPSTQSSEEKAINAIKEILKINIINTLKNETIEKLKEFKISFDGNDSYIKQEIILICNGIEEHTNYPQVDHHFTTILSQPEDKIKLSKITFGKSIPLRYENGLYVRENSPFNETTLFDCTLEIVRA